MEDLVDLKQARTVRPRPPTLTSIPALLSTFQNEWDAIVLESFQLKQQLAETRQELSTALYYNDAAEKVIARLQKERDEARDALANVSITSNGTNGASADSMQVDGQGLPEHIVAKIDETQKQLSSTRRKRAVPEDWASPEVLQSFDVKHTSEPLYKGSRSLAVDTTGDMVLLGGSDSVAGVYSISQGQLVQTLQCDGGAVVDGLWYGDKPVVALSTGAVKVFDNGKQIATFEQHAGTVAALALHPCGEILASVGTDKIYILYDLVNLKPITQIFSSSGTWQRQAVFLRSLPLMPIFRVQNGRVPP